MQLHLDWTGPVPLTDGSYDGLIYTCDLEEVPAVSGIYIFGRRHGSRMEALYVGQAKTIRKRVKEQLQNVRLMKHLEGAKAGTRFVFAGSFAAKGGQQLDKSLRLMERAFIRYFLSEQNDLANVHGTRLAEHEIASSGAKDFIPSLLYVER